MFFQIISLPWEQDSGSSWADRTGNGIQGVTMLNPSVFVILRVIKSVADRLQQVEHFSLICRMENVPLNSNAQFDNSSVASSLL